MQPLSQEFLDQCPEDQGFRLRGLEMTRIEVFVDAAFAFAVTMLVISFDQIPRTFEEMTLAIKGIPAFAVAVAQLVWIWYEHHIWSRRFGLDDAMTVFLSALLLIVVLVYIYPLRIMAQGMFSWFTGGYLPSGFALESVDELRFMFAFMGIGFAALCTVFALLYGWTRHRADPLRLSGGERYRAQTVARMWLGCALIGLSSVTLALIVPDGAVPFSGFTYALLGAWIPWYSTRRDRYQSEHFPVHY